MFTAKKVTVDPVRLENDDRVIDVYITQPKMEKSAITLEVGDKQAISFSYDSDHIGVQWYSSAPDVAKISDDGIIEAVGKGTCTITAFVNGTAYNCKIKVKETVAAEERTLHMMVGSHQSVRFKGIKNLIWTADDMDMIRIKGNTFTGLIAGETFIRSSNGEKEYVINVFVEDPVIITSGIIETKKNKYTVKLYPGQSTKVEFKYFTQPVIFKSNKAEVAYTDADGTIVARKSGKAKMTGKINGKTITINVQVENEE